jgi:hypothetical protein
MTRIPATAEKILAKSVGPTLKLSSIPDLSTGEEKTLSSNPEP